MGFQLARRQLDLTNPNAVNGNYAGATFIHYENLGYDFLFGDGTAASRSGR